MIRILFIFLLLIFTVPQARAETDHLRARLLAAYEGTGSFTEIEMGLELTLDDQWYTYWRMPGDAGLAPVMNWEGSQNIKDVAVSWPAPKRFTAFDMHSFGYSGMVVLPLKVTPEKAGEAVTLRLKLDVVVCHEICIPQTLTLEKIIPEGPAARSVDRTVLTEAIAVLPAAENSRELGIETAILGKDGITIIAYSREPFGAQTDMFVQSPDIILTAVPEIMPQDGDKKAVIKIKAPEGSNLASVLLNKKVIITLKNGDQLLEREFSF